MKKAFLVIIILILIALIGWAMYLFLIKKELAGEPGKQEEISAPKQDESEDIIFIDESPNDQDRDGISDEDEALYGTSDTEYDTDGDGLSDYAEIFIYFTDPTKVDTDGDGYADGWEVLKGYNPAGEGML